MFNDTMEWTDFGWDQQDFQSPWNDSGELTFGDLNPGDVWEMQDTPFTCAVVSQQMILRDFGFDVSESQLVYHATVNGWLTEDGTSIQDMGRLLEAHGVPTHENFSGDLESLVYELSQGHKVIAAVDSGELWGTDFPFADFFEPGGGDHAIVISGVNLSDPDNPRVVINDPGEPNGAGREYPLDEFLDAWQDSGNAYVATDSAPPDLASHPILGSHFDPQNEFYLDPGFWTSLIAAVTASYAVWEHIGEGAEAASTSIWEDLSGADRDELFQTI
jgi:hypothetical protein